MESLAQPSLLSYYAARAAEYERVYAKPERQADLQQLRRSLPSSFAGKSVLELACGTGYWTRVVAPHVRRLVALDAAPETLAIARQQPTAGPVEWRQADVYDLPRDLGFCDAAFAGFWFSHVPRARQRSFLQGLSSVLAPGARVVLLDNRFVPGSSTPVHDVDDHGDSYQMRSLEDGSRHRVLKNFPDADGMAAALDGVGINLVWTELAYYWLACYDVPAR